MPDMVSIILLLDNPITCLALFQNHVCHQKAYKFLICKQTVDLVYYSGVWIY